MRQALAATTGLVALGLAALGAASTAVAAAPTLPGTYITTISGKKPAAINGEWAIELSRNGAYVILKRINKTQGRVEVRGRALLKSKHLVVFTKETGPLACKPTGTYRWTRNGHLLTFVRLRDTCSGRRIVLGGTFTRVA